MKRQKGKKNKLFFGCMHTVLERVTFVLGFSKINVSQGSFIVARLPNGHCHLLTIFRR